MPDEQRPARTLGLALREARLARDIAQTDAAAAIGVPPSTLSRWENDRRTPSVRDLRRTARILGLDLDELAALVEPDTDATGKDAA